MHGNIWELSLVGFEGNLYESITTGTMSLFIPGGENATERKVKKNWLLGMANEQRMARKATTPTEQMSKW